MYRSRYFAFAAIAALSCLLSVSAGAADLSYRKAAPIAALSAPGYNWSGFYIGAHGGYGWGTTQDVTNAGAAERSLKGGFGGVQAGYNWQTGPIVFGLEADVSYGSVSNSWGGTNQFDPYYGKDSQNLFGTARGRIGYAFDRTLIYATGGLAWAQNEHGFGCDATRVTVTNGCQNRPGGQAFFVKQSPVDIGYVVGGGIEHAISNNWSIKAEYLYADYGTNKITMVDPNYPAAKADRNFSTATHRTLVGLNYKF